MARNYYQLLPYVFKRFCIVRALRTALPTALYYARRRALPQSSKPALFTMNILPPMMTVWYHFAQKNLRDDVDITIFDCSGALNPKEFPKARVQKFLNFYAATKSDEFLYHIARNRKIGWICDDDMFPMHHDMLDVLQKEFSDPNTASVSFRPRDWWHYEIDGTSYDPSSSYCVAFNREIFCNKEQLSLAPANGNTHPSHIGKKMSRYDTYDKANELFIRKGYRCYIVPKEDRSKYLTGFSGMSGAVMLLYYFKNPEQVMDYFLTPPKKNWSGNVLYGVLASMLSICTIQELYTKLTGKTYPLHSLPPHIELERIRKDHTQYLREDHNFEWIDEVSERLHKEL
jgi:hypothetical protein